MLEDESVTRSDREAPAAGGADLDATLVDGRVRPLIGEPTTGCRFGPYEIFRELGEGGQATVHLARDTRLNRTVALKVLRADHRSPLTRERFRREAAVAAKIDDPSICTVYDVGEEQGRLWIAMRHVEGSSLDRCIASARAEGRSHSATTLPAPTERPGSGEEQPTDGRSHRALFHGERPDVSAILRYFEKAARALHLAHEAGLVHRDLKPHNLMVTPEGEPVVLDFGLAQDLENEQPSLTVSGGVAGTPAYMSPEQVMGRPLDRRTDVWSLGVSLYEALTLQRLFSQATHARILQDVLDRPIVDPRRLAPELSRDLAVVVLATLERDRNRRYATALDLAIDLKNVAERQPIRARPASPWLKVRLWSRRHPAVALLSFLVFLSLSLGLLTNLKLLRRSERARRDADLSNREKGRALGELERLSDGKRLETLLHDGERLYPALPERLPAIEEWITRATALAGNLPTHEASLESIRRTAREPDAEWRRLEDERHAEDQAALEQARNDVEFYGRQRESLLDEGSDAEIDRLVPALDKLIDRARGSIPVLEERIARRQVWLFDQPEMQWRHDLLAGLVDGLRALTAEDGAIADMTRRRDLARDLGRRSLEEARDLWTRTLDELRDPQRSPLPGGFAMTPQIGLLPLGRDPESGLFEFAHLASGKVPDRDAAGRLVIDQDTAIILVLLPGGRFTLGSRRKIDDGAGMDDEGDVHSQPLERPQVEIDVVPFFMSKFELTQGQWRRLTGRSPSLYAAGFVPLGGRGVDDRHPVEQISFFEARRQLRQVDLDLPREYEWEYAARAGSRTAWWTGPDRESLRGAANLADQAARRAGATWPALDEWPDLDDGFALHAPVGSFRANAFGLHDVLGNVWEWTLDALRSYDLLADGKAAVPLPQSNEVRVIRGGSYLDGPSVARVTTRNSNAPDSKDGGLGCRPARAIRNP